MLAVGCPLMLFVVKIIVANMQIFAAGVPVAAMVRLAVSHLVAVLFLTLFVVKAGSPVAPKEPNVKNPLVTVASHIFCLC